MLEFFEVAKVFESISPSEFLGRKNQEYPKAHNIRFFTN